MKIDKRKNYYLIFDTETTGGDVNIKLIYDIGYTIADKKQIYIKRNYLVKEIFENEELMNTAYYVNKIPKYKEMVKNGEVDIKPFAEIVKILQNDLHNYNVKFACAYNINFDLDAFMQTTEHIYVNRFKMLFRPTKSGKWAPDYVNFVKKYIFKDLQIEILDIWTMACQTLCNQKTFQAFYKKTTARGNIISNAEIVYNYVNDLNGEFVESHTALSDSEVETEILQRILKLRKPEFTIAYFPFRLIKAC